MQSRHCLFALLPIAMLAGCAGMSEQACLVTDWRSVGFEDGIAGRSEGSIGGYRQACSKYGVAPDLDQYRAGHAEGVQSFCRPGQGFEAGRSGSRYQGVCPADLEPAFLEAFAEGRQLYELEAALRSIDNQIAARNRRLEVLTREIGSAGAAIIAEGTSSEERAQLLLDAAAMAKEQGQIAKELEALQGDRVLAENDLLAYRQTTAYSF